MLDDAGFAGEIDQLRETAAGPGSDTDAVPPEFTDEALALRFTAQHKGFSGELFYGYQLDDVGAKKHGTLQNQGIHFQVQYAF